MKTMTKNEFRFLTLRHGCIARYSGKLKKFFVKRLTDYNINEIINLKIQNNENKH